MDSGRLPLGVVLFGLGAGAAAEIVAQEAVSGLTGVWAVLMAGGSVAVLGLAVWTIARWPAEFQATAVLVGAFLGFLYWGAWLTGPAQVTTNLSVIDPMMSYEQTRIRNAGLVVIAISIGILSWVTSARGSSVRDN